MCSIQYLQNANYMQSYGLWDIERGVRLVTFAVRELRFKCRQTDLSESQNTRQNSISASGKMKFKSRVAACFQALNIFQRHDEDHCPGP